MQENNKMDSCHSFVKSTEEWATASSEGGKLSSGSIWEDLTLCGGKKLNSCI